MCNGHDAVAENKTCSETVDFLHPLDERVKRVRSGHQIRHICSSLIQYDGNSHGSGMSLPTTASPKSPCMVGDAVVGRGNAGWTDWVVGGT